MAIDHHVADAITGSSSSFSLNNYYLFLFLFSACFADSNWLLASEDGTGTSEGSLQEHATNINMSKIHLTTHFKSIHWDKILLIQLASFMCGSVKSY